MKYPMAHKIKKPFEYTSAAATQVGKTIDKERKRLAKIAELQEHFSKVTPIRKEGKA